MVSMELDDEDKFDACMPVDCPKPDYPYGLRICLTHKELAALGLEPDCDLGDMLHFKAMARVTSVSMNESASDKSIRIEAQIEMMAVEDEDRE